MRNWSQVRFSATSALRSIPKRDPAPRRRNLEVETRKQGSSFGHIYKWKNSLDFTPIFIANMNMCIYQKYWSQSRQSTKLFIQSSELGLPKPLTRRRVCPPPPLVPREGAHSLAREGVGESKFRRGDIHYGTLYCIYMYFVILVLQAIRSLHQVDKPQRCWHPIWPQRSSVCTKNDMQEKQ
jgi:hypothetical protein